MVVPKRKALTTDDMQKGDSTINETCALCGCEQETMDHLFLFSCCVFVMFMLVGLQVELHTVHLARGVQKFRDKVREEC